MIPPRMGTAYDAETTWKLRQANEVNRQAFRESKHKGHKGAVMERVIVAQVGGKPCGLDLIAAERKRQKEQEGFDPTRDVELYTDGELALAGACYALGDLHRSKEMYGEPPPEWPWGKEWWKPTPQNRVGELAKAGALIAAEIDRLQAEGK